MPGRILSWRSIHISYPDRYNEVIDEDLKPRPEYEAFFVNLSDLGTQKFSEEVRNASIIAFLEGFTFNIEPGQYRPIPMDFIPRIVRKKTFDHIARGLKQRAIALNKLLQDVYSGEKTIIPDEVIYGSKYFYPDLIGLTPRHGIFIHVYGADLLFDGIRFKIIEDNLRVPSGVAYQLKIRELGERFLPQLREDYQIAEYRPWEHLKKAMRDASWARDPFMVLLSDGPYDSAYFEHRYLANLLGIPLVEGSDLRVDEGGYVVLRLPGEGEVQVDVIYRRIEDLDIFVPGLSKAYADGKVALVNAWGTGVADDKLVYHYIPQVIREYLGEDPIIPQPKTYAPIEPGDLLEIRRKIQDLVVKTREGYGGFGTIVLPDYKGEVRDKIARDVLNRITLEPDHYIAQELVKFSTTLLHSDSAPLLLRDAPIDLRVYVYYTAEGPQVPPGGLSRYARHGMITNNSSGGGIKETWVIS